MPIRKLARTLLEQQTQPAPPPPVDVHLDLSGLAASIWQWFIDHIGDVGNAILSAVTNTVQNAGQAIWDAVWHSSLNILTQIPPDLSYNFGPYKAVATDPIPVAVGGATLAFVLLGFRTIVGAVYGGDHALTHVLTRLIPATFMTLAYPMLVARGIGLVNAAAYALGSTPIGQGIVSGIGRLLLFPAMPNPALTLPYLLLWMIMLWVGIRLLMRLAYGLFRLLAALIFGPVAVMLWAIPQTEWVTSFWVRELLGWATTPLLVTACLAVAIPLASGQEGFLSAAVFGIAGMQAAYDLVGLLAHAQRSTNLYREAAREVYGVMRFALGDTPGALYGELALSEAGAKYAEQKFGY